MNTAMQVFNFKTQPLTVITDEQGTPWFIAKEVSELLSYSDQFEMTKKLDEDEVQNLQIAGFGNRGVNVINESGFWSSILRSTKPEAKAFKKFFTSEVLPALRKQGFYGKVEPKHYLAVTKRISEVSRLLSESKNPFLSKTLLEQLKTFHMMAGSTMPDLRLLGGEVLQNDWINSQGGAA